MLGIVPKSTVRLATLIFSIVSFISGSSCFCLAQELEDADYLDGGNMSSITPGTVKGYPNEMWVRFAGNVLLLKSKSKTLCREIDSPNNKESKSWIDYYKSLADQIGFAWKSKVEGEALAIIQMDKSKNLKIARVLKSFPATGNPEFEAAISAVLSAASAKQAEFIDPDVEKIQFAARFLSSSKTSKSQLPAEEFYPSIAARSLVRAASNLQAIGFKDISQNLYMEAHKLLDGTSGKGLSISEARNELARAEANAGSVQQPTPFLESILQNEVKNHALPLLAKRDYADIAAIVDQMNIDRNRLDQDKLTMAIFTSLAGRYDFHKNSDINACMDFFERAFGEAKNKHLVSLSAKIESLYRMWLMQVQVFADPATRSKLSNRLTNLTGLLPR